MGNPNERAVVATGLRMPADLHAKLQDEAKANHRSLNSQILHMLTQQLNTGD